jgi:hypothetical protein
MDRPRSIAAMTLATCIRDFDVDAMRAEIGALRSRMRELGWPEPHANADSDAALCHALTECQQIIVAYLRGAR